MSIFRQITNSIARLTERGDTVVEVLISIAVVSLILGGAFVTSSQSLQGTRSAEERSNALKMAETQIEQIKYLAAAKPDVVFDNGMSSFCLASNTAYVATDSQCTVDSAGAPSSVQPAYSLSVRYEDATFTVTSEWTRIGSDQKNSVRLKYRAYP